MRSGNCNALAGALIKALAFAAMLTVALPGVCVTPSDPRAADGGSPPQVTTTREDHVPAEADQEDSSLLTRPWFSTLGALALGVLGLLWMRRRATEL